LTRCFSRILRATDFPTALTSLSGIAQKFGFTGCPAADDTTAASKPQVN
jgi:hypothetical protein